MSTIVEHHRKSEMPAFLRTVASIEEESSWRWNTNATLSEDRSSFEIGRWKKWFAGTHELVAPTFNNHYTVEVLLGESYVDCFRDEQHIIGKLAGYGATQVAAPGQKIRCRFDRSTEAIHLFISRSTVAAACEELQQRNCADHGKACRSSVRGSKSERNLHFLLYGKLDGSHPRKNDWYSKRRHR
jgi:AraC family transcriptional regulator